MSADPTTWGVQAAGFVAPNADEIIQATNADLLAYVSPDFDTDPDSPDGQVDGIRARQLAKLWETLGTIHDANNPDNAEGELLVDLCKLTGTTKQGPQATTVQATVALTSGTLLANGTALASLFNHPDILFTPAADYTASADGSYVITFVCVAAGPTAVPPGTLTVISTPLTGWTSITNVSAGVLGNNGDSDTTLRARRDAELSASGSTTTDAIRSDVLQLPGVISCQVLTNRTGYVDANGLPPHTFETVTYTSGADATALAQTIFLNQPAGIMSTGATHLTYVDTDGNTQDVYYTEVAQVPITLTYTLATTTGYVGDTQAAQLLASSFTAESEPGKPVKALATQAGALALTGVSDVLAFTINGGSTNISISPRQIATFAPANITVTS